MPVDENAAGNVGRARTLAQQLIQNMWEVRQQATKLVKPFGLNLAGFYLLDLIARGYAHPSDLAERLDIGREAASTMLTKLVGQNLVERTTSEHDGRFHVITLTDKGRALHQEIFMAWEELLVRRYSTLNEAKAALFLEILQEVNHTSRE